MSKKCIVLGAGGFIGGHLAQRLVEEDNKVTGVDIKNHEFRTPSWNHCVLDLSDQSKAVAFLSKYVEMYGPPDEVFQLAADMGGAGYIFTGEHDADVMTNSGLINLNVATAIRKTCGNKIPRIFYSSSACMYPGHNQTDPNNPNCSEASAYPANPDSEYGWEKLFSERLYLSYHRNYGWPVRVARFHNIFGILSTWQGGREKAPAAVCRKIASANDGDTVEFWGTGDQTRSFLYVTECVEGILRLTRSDFTGPVNIGSDEMVTIRDLVNMALEFSGKNLNIKWTGGGPVGVAGRNSDNRLIKEKLGWAPNYPLKNGMKLMYDWVDEQVRANK